MDYFIDDKDIIVERIPADNQSDELSNTGIRIVHIPTGLITTSTKYMSQLANKLDAVRLLNIKLKRKKSVYR